jgi:Ca2+-binding EF-hand superfamily protein
MLALAACGNNTVGTISGTVSAPAGQSITNTTVLFCVVKSNNTEECGDANSKLITITASGSNATFTSPDLVAAEFKIFAHKDNDSDGKISVGDFFSVLKNSIGDEITLQPPKTGISLPRMKVVD